MGRRGTLWGPRATPTLVGPQSQAQPRPGLPQAARRSEATDRHLAALGDLTAPASLSDHDWLNNKLMPPIWALARADEPGLGAALTARLEAPFPERSLHLLRRPGQGKHIDPRTLVSALDPGATGRRPGVAFSTHRALGRPDQSAGEVFPSCAGSGLDDGAAWPKRQMTDQLAALVARLNFALVTRTGWLVTWLGHSRPSPSNASVMTTTHGSLGGCSSKPKRRSSISKI